MKKFLIIGNANAITYKEVFPLIKENKIWLGTQYVKEFVSDSGETKKFGNILWYTNLDHNKRHEEIILYKKYNEAEYPQYDEYDAIEVSKVCDIPMDYEGIMGVPVTFMNKYCPDQFEVLGCSAYSDAKYYGNPPLYVNGNKKYARILIRFRK
jgi:hypothetical protein